VLESIQKRFSDPCVTLSIDSVVIAVPGLTSKQCRDMQAVVMLNFMVRAHDPVAAKEILEALGLARKFSNEEPGGGDVAITLLMGKGPGGTFK
jgi:hypothetical protein